MNRFGRLFGAAFLLTALAAVVVGALLASDRLAHRPRTDDAYLDADVVHMAPDVSGRVTVLAVHDNQVVHAGDLLFRIDPEPYRLQLEQARAQLFALQATLAITGNQVASQGSKADAAATGIGTAEAQLALASATLSRLQPLLARGFVTAEQVDQARTAEHTARISLQQARQEAEEARQGISSTRPTEAQVVAAQATMALAARNLRLTDVRSPCDGVISGLDTSVGEYGEAGHPLFTIIDSEHWYAVGNFRETVLGALHAGQAARVYVLGASGPPVEGVVESLAAGVSPDEGVTLGGLPRVPRSLSWVRIAQRFPVRVLLHAPPPAMMRLGASAVIVIDR